MRSFHLSRIGGLTVATAAALASAGCPELNRYPDRTPPGQFSVADPAGRNTDHLGGDTGDASQFAPLGPTQFMISEEGGLPDQSRRAQ